MITIDLDLPLPIEEQLCRQLRDVIARGEVRPGDPLPSVRQLADDLGIHWNTVARAYRRLREEGLLHVALGRGAFVRAASVPDGAVAELRDRIRDDLQQLMTKARLAGLSAPDLRRLFAEELRAWSKRKEKR